MKGIPTLHIFPESRLGKGFVVDEADFSFINCKSMGENCYVNQNVAIGVVGVKSPVIDDEVRIVTGAIVIGGEYIGDNVTIAAGV